MTPAAVHFGQAARLRADRQRVLDAAYAATPERFVRGHHPAHAAYGSVDQQADHRGGCSLNSTTKCLIRVDRLRAPDRTI
jgi:hypothetical protein